MEVMLNVPLPEDVDDQKTKPSNHSRGSFDDFCNKND